jgi:hypothetical protein
MIASERNLRMSIIKQNEKKLSSNQKNFTPSKSGKFSEPIPSQ